ncbi:uncharacterized protein LOC127261271 [Andrographis paniculata]|uniref:uncharacterized protein LOC127261271 n=1 Tax=Andrographis paniculata TaxID=175694 RepID=UPI0021E97805|nr:uncharacterized protein LOC127261271 [Andrographis paniculata]XP_051145503.1 uncharacterized protein LOC127261271 [Andrographis paniculata]XP_051145504.1 uncharacterized protein LOC127261271 [Andrographis paniculata]
MNRVSMGHSDHRPCSAEKTLRRCINREKAEDVILIDADSEIFDNVIVVDTPESFPKRKVGSGRFRKDKCSLKNVIYIDDDETPSSSHSGDANKSSFVVNTSSNRETRQETTNTADPTGDAAEGCQYAQDNTTPVRLSKCKRTYSGKTFRGNRFGLHIDSESDSSDSDYPDCVLVEDSSGKVQELWEKAFRRRKHTYNGPSGFRYRGSTSQNLGKDQHQSSGTEDVIRQQKEAAFCFSKEKSNNKASASYTYASKQDSGFGCSRAFDDLTDSDNTQSAQKTHLRNGVSGRSTSHAKGYPSNYTKQVDLPDYVPGGFNSDNVESDESLAAPAFGDDHQAPSREKEGACCRRPGSCTDKDPVKFNPRNDHPKFEERDADSAKENEHLATLKANKKEKFMPERFTSKRSTSPHSQTNPNPSSSSGAVRSIFEDVEQGHHQENKQPVPEMPWVNIDLNQIILEDDDSQSSSDQEESEDGLVVPTPNVDTTPSVENSIINEREKIKETNEYKRAMEEEWASRQRALAIQAEEAQRLRRQQKRKKAESMRLLDMERRQKQRLEEIRNSQRKEEENMSLKETIRAEVRNVLMKVENTSPNMASLLHSLGVHVSGWPNPLPQQVQTAYKKALLTFHPDRASQSDLRLQVEAEEKFKLINRMKEKFHSSTMLKA